MKRILHKGLLILRVQSSPLVASILIFLCYELSIFNVFSELLDEGFLQYNAYLITQGQIPYRDFFLSVTPGTFYTLAFFYKLMGNYIVLERILGIFTAIATLYVCNKLFKFKIFFY